MEHIAEILIALAVVALGVYLKARHSLDVNHQVREILDRAAALGIGLAEEDGKRDGLKGEQKEAVAIDAAKAMALEEAKRAGRNVVKKVAAAIGGQAGGAIKGLIRAKLGLGRLF